MFEFLFPIFCFGLVVTGIVAKGLLTAADFAEAQKRLDGSVNAEPGPMSPDPIDSAKALITTPSAEWFRGQPRN